jgi:RHH-type proline utilization regulon transcriptional repressor/proline dehydrogenase/delta 1-pyrroline-5-carboxylate dehydrogenase
MKAPSDNEVRDLARHMAKLSSARSNVYRMSWWNEKLMSLAMSKPEFKAQLFRFVDVFPATTSDRDILRHVEEYLDGEYTPSALRKAIHMAASVPFGSNVTASQARRNIARMADQFILGETAAEAAAGAKKLWDAGSGTIVDLLGEKTVADAEGDQYAARVMEIVTALTTAAPTWQARPLFDNDDIGQLPRTSLALKATALSSKYKPLSRVEGIREVKARVRPILRAAKEQGCLVWFDAEHFEVKDITLDLFREVLDEQEFHDLEAGMVFQAYLRETHRDLAEFIAWSAKRSKPAFVRLVKGAYWDTETIVARQRGWQVPVYERKIESDANYERCSRLLLDHHGEVRAAFASHNLRSLAYAISYARKNNIPDNAFEVQMLYGMAEPMHEAVRKMNLRLRVYAPVGELVPGMAYLVRRLLENTSNDSFVRMRFSEGKSLDALLEAPKVDNLPDPPTDAERDATTLDSVEPYEPEPVMEWHRLSRRTQMQSAIESTSGKGPEDVPAIIDGRRISTATEILSVNPSDPSDIVAKSASCAPGDVEQAMRGALLAQKFWGAKPAQERAAVLFRTAHWMRTHKFDLAALQVREAGKPWADADGDVCEAIDFCEYYGREALRLAQGGAVQSPPGEHNSLTYKPRGVGVVIAPWNFPFAIPVGMVVAALVTGNAVLFKPAEQTPTLALRIYEALEASGLPKGVLQFLPGVGEDIGPVLVEHPETAFVAFTGSRPVGLSIVESAGKWQPGQRQIKKLVVELGGKNPMYIDSDADLDQAVPAIVYSAFGFAGQKCSALSRLLVHEDIADALVERLVGAVADLKIGDPSAMAVDVGPVIDAEAQERIKGVVDGAYMWGTVAVSRTDLPETGYFAPPTVVVDVKPDSPLARDEIFGPVLSVFRVRDLQAAISLSNDSEYALTAGLFSRSPANIRKFAEEVEAGNVYVNRQITGAVVGRQAFGGYKLSGGGTKAGGPDYLLNFVEPKSVTENVVRQGFAELQ